MVSIIYIDEVNSTNSYLKEIQLDKKQEEGTIVATHHQVAGRGQKGNSWESERGKNLAFSMILYPTFIPVLEQFILSQITSLAVKDILDKYTSDISIKWPNDIYWREKKICGILIENILSENKIAESIIGVGININQEKFRSDAPNPISLKQITNSEYSLETILSSVQEKLLSYYEGLRLGNRESIIQRYKESLFRKDGYHLYNDGKNDFEARIKDIQSTGHLILETKDREERCFAFKEVKYVLD